MASNSIKAVCAVSRTPLKTTPAHSSRTASELLYGEPLDIISDQGDWLQIVSLLDGYKGWVVKQAVHFAVDIPTHKTHACLTHVYSAPDLKSAPLMPLPMGAYVCVDTNNNDSQKFLALSSGGFLFKAHVVRLGTFEKDPVAVAEKFIACPYLWGGRSYMGIDCSGLVQVSLACCGLRSLRDSTSQHKSLGRALAPNESPRRGDLAFFNGHVGWMIDDRHILHANATHMSVTIDPVHTVLGWLNKELGAKAFLEYRRLSNSATD